ncbi:amino acid permease, partial [Yersinia enterocolitica]
GGSAPKFMSKMSPQSVPYAGILVTVGIYVFGVVLNFLVPSQVFEIVLNIASLGIISSWAFIIVCQMKLRQAIKNGTAKPVAFKMPGAPVTSWLTLFFLAGVLIMMALDYPNGTWTVATLPVIAVLLVIGWFSLRKRAQEVAAEHRNMPVKESGTKAVPPLICMNKSQ